MQSFLDRDHPLFAMARTGKQLTSMLPMFGLTLVFVVITALIAGGVLIGGMGVTSIAEMSGWAFLVLLALLIVWAGLTLTWMRYYEGRSPLTLGLAPERAVFKFVRGGLIGFGVFGLVLIGLTLVGGVQAVDGERPITALLLLIGWIVQGTTEEIVFRGWMLTTLGARHSPLFGIIVSSVVFGLLHSANPSFSPLAALNITLFGLFFALYALREGGLWGVCALHAVWNWVLANGFGLPVSGVNFPGGSLLHLQITPTAPAWATGGAFGPEGGAITTVVVVGLIAVVILWPRRKQLSQ